MLFVSSKYHSGDMGFTNVTYYRGGDVLSHVQLFSHQGIRLRLTPCIGGDTLGRCLSSGTCMSGQQVAQPSYRVLYLLYDFLIHNCPSGRPALIALLPYGRATNKSGYGKQGTQARLVYRSTITRYVEGSTLTTLCSGFSICTRIRQ